MYGNTWASFHHAGRYRNTLRNTLINVFATNTGDNDLFPSRYLMHFKIYFILNKQSSDNKLRNYFSTFVYCPKRLFIQSTKRSISLYFPSDS